MQSRHGVARANLLANRARQMRFAQSEPEERLWRLIRGKQLGASFRRQVVLGRYIVDFLAPGARLVVEVDGAQHATRARRAADARRDAWLAGEGYRVLRLEARLVLERPAVAVERVRRALGG